MAPRATRAQVNYKEVESDEDGDAAQSYCSSDDDDADLKALMALAPILTNKKHKNKGRKVGMKGVGDTYGTGGCESNEGVRAPAQSLIHL